MDVAELITLSDKLQKDADRVIEKSKVVQILEKIGRVEFVGSYALNLLYRPDIDLFVVSSDCSRSTAVSTTKEFLDSNLFQTVGFANCTDYTCANGLPGYYWELIFEFSSRRWKFDVWYTAETDIRTIKKTQIIKAKLEKNSEARSKILQLKDGYFDGEKYRDGMNGFKIYESVLGKL